MVGVAVDVRVAVAEAQTVEVAVRVGRVVGAVVGVLDGAGVSVGDGGGAGGENDAPRASGLLFRTSSMASAISISTITTMGAMRDGCSAIAWLYKYDWEAESVRVLKEAARQTSEVFRGIEWYTI